MTYRDMGRETNGNSNIYIYIYLYIYIEREREREMNILKIQIPKKGHYYFKKDEPIQFLAETRMFSKWERC